MESQHQNGVLPSIKEKIDDSLAILDSLFTDYQPEEIFLSFNGGKDCTVLLHMVVQVLRRLGHQPGVIKYIYVQPEAPFTEIEEFVAACERHYGIQMEIYRGGIRSTLEKVCTANPNLRAVLMGSRRTDPYCSDMVAFQKTDPGWPPLMRVSPLLDWTCDNIWQFLLDHQVPYCLLYDVGYTSIGDRTNTVPNPHLKRPDGTYRPAYELRDADHLERAGRL